MSSSKKRPGTSTPGAKLINKGGKSPRPNTAAKKAKGGANTKGSSKRGF